MVTHGVAWELTGAHTHCDHSAVSLLEGEHVFVALILVRLVSRENISDNLPVSISGDLVWVSLFWEV